MIAAPVDVTGKPESAAGQRVGEGLVRRSRELR